MNLFKFKGRIEMKTLRPVSKSWSSWLCIRINADGPSDILRRCTDSPLSDERLKMLDFFVPLYGEDYIYFRLNID